MCSTTITNLLKLARPHLFLLENCKTMADLMKFHAHFITTGHSNDTLFLSTILSFTALSPNGNLAYARLVFNHINTPNTFMFNTMIRGYSCSYPLQALSLHHQMLQTGLLLNNYTYPFVIKALSKFVDHRYGETVHASIVKSGYVLDLHISNSLLRMYASFGLSKDVVKLFDEMPEPDVVSWNVVINDLAEYGCLDDALVAFREMCHCGIEPDSVTLLGLLSGCTKNGDLCTGKLIHLCIVQRDVHVTGNLGNGLLDMYAKFGDMDSAKKLFDRMETKLNVFSWTSMVDGYIRRGELESASMFFNQMPEKDATAWNVMLNGFITVGDLISAALIFEEMPEKDLVSWNCMIVGCAQNKIYVDSLEFFRKMLVLGVKPDRITLVSVLSVCGFVGALDLGEMTHSYMEKQNIKEEEVEIGLMDMYCKCGAHEKAMRVFNGISWKSELVWSAMIFGLATNGLASEALEFFRCMQKAGVKPNEITFIGVLCACSYGGFVEQGKWFFNAMTEIYGITPRSEHFGCMVDILGRAGLLEEAEMFILNLPVKADAGVWGALLGACRMHNEVQMGEKVARILNKSDPSHSGRYILLSNIYAAGNRWIDAEKVRKKMKASRVQKMPGFSLIGLKGEMRQFFAGN